MDNFAKNNSSP